MFGDRSIYHILLARVLWFQSCVSSIYGSYKVFLVIFGYRTRSQCATYVRLFFRFFNVFPVRRKLFRRVSRPSYRFESFICCIMSYRIGRVKYHFSPCRRYFRFPPLYFISMSWIFVCGVSMLALATVTIP